MTTICPAGIETEFAIGRGRDAADPQLQGYLRPEDVAEMVKTVLEQPRRLRTTIWQVWPMSQES